MKLLIRISLLPLAVASLLSTSQVALGFYDPSGSILSCSQPLVDTNVCSSSTKELHLPSGLSYYLYRYYDSNHQRWLNRDPIEEQGGPNLFTFVFNNPVNIVDLLGLDCYRQNRQLFPKYLNHSPWPRSRYNPLSHTFVFTTNPDGTLKHTYSWGTDANTRGWKQDYGPDRAAANQALKDGGNHLHKIGDSSLDDFIDKAFHQLDKKANEHKNGGINHNCKSEATNLENKAKELEKQQDQDQTYCAED